MTSLQGPETPQEGKPVNRNESTARTRHTRKARLKSLAARPALTALVAAGMIAGSTGMAVAVTSSSAPALASASGVPGPAHSNGWINLLGDPPY
jgi:hypothetical protein